MPVHSAPPRPSATCWVHDHSSGSDFRSQCAMAPILALTRRVRRRIVRSLQSSGGGTRTQCEPQHVAGLGPRRARRAYDPEEDDMRLGVVFPQTEIGSDPAVIRDYAQAAESAGYDHLLVFDHVLGAKLERFDKLGRRPPYTDQSPFHEVFVLFGYLGACTQRLELVTGIVILPQRQTALVAKQAAAVDVLTRGRLRLGVGIGWNHVEYEGLNEDFHTRGRRVSEQIAVMRKLWTEPVVTFKGSYHQLDRAGINPLPV